MVFDDDDYELIEENNRAFCHPTSEICKQLKKATTDVYIISQVMKKMKWPDLIVDDEVKDVYNVQSRRNGNKNKPGRVREPTIFFKTIRSKKPKVKDEFEPIVNSEKYLTKEDDNIRKTDILERMQRSQKSQ
nr:hypothetical protein [Tanacetum cinerariifolium]